jgi:hypothetical protein
MYYRISYRKTWNHYPAPFLVIVDAGSNYFLTQRQSVWLSNADTDYVLCESGSDISNALQINFYP